MVAFDLWEPRLFFQVEFRADSLYLPLLRMAQDSSQLIHAVGKLSFQCTPAQPVLPIAFTSKDSYLVSSN